MNNKKLLSRIVLKKASIKKDISKDSVKPRRDAGWVDKSELDSNFISNDFFEFEKELSELKASNKNNELTNDKNSK